MTSNHVGNLITSTIITLQHFTTLHHTSPNYTSLHLYSKYLSASQRSNSVRINVSAHELWQQQFMIRSSANQAPHTGTEVTGKS